MKITIVQGAFLPVPPIMGGAVEKMWFLLGQEFARCGHNVVHISRTHSELAVTQQIHGVKHVRVSGYDTPSSILKLKLLDFLYSRRACRVIPTDSNIVVTNTFWSPVLLSRALKSKTYVDVARMPKGQMRFYRHARLRANSTPVAAAIKKELPTKEHGRVTMIPNPLPFEVREQIEITSKQPVFLYCGRIHPEKGLHLLIEAMRFIDNPWPLRIVGPWQTEQGGGGRSYREELISKSQGLPVKFIGPLHDLDALNGEYKTASIFVYPSIAEKGETFGLAVLEAMAWGCAPIVSDLACFKDFIHSEKSGFIFNHRDSKASKNLASVMQMLMVDSSLRTNLAIEALKVRETHSLKLIARMFLDDFTTMIKLRCN